MRGLVKSSVRFLGILNVMTFASSLMDSSASLKSYPEIQLLEQIRRVIALGPQAHGSAIRLRREVAERWMASDKLALESRFNTALGEATRELVETALNNLPSAPEDLRMLDKIAEEFPNGFTTPEGVRALLAAMCLRPADRIEMAFDFSSFPEWLMSSTMCYLLLRRNFFAWPGDLERHCARLNRAVDSALRAIEVSDPEKANMIAALCLGYLVLVPFYFQEASPTSIIKKRAQLFSCLYPPSRSFLPPPAFGPAAASGRIRLGILRPNFNHSAESYATLPISEHLDRGASISRCLP